MLSFLLQAVDETYVSNGRLFTFFLLIACKMLNVFLLSPSFLKEWFMFYLIVVGCFPVRECGKCYSYSVFLVYSCKHSPAWYPVHLVAAIVTLPVAFLKFCASGLLKLCGFSKHRYCVDIACSSLLIMLVMLCWPKLHINCFMCSVLQFKDELFLILNTLIFCHLNLCIEFFLGSHCEIFPVTSMKTNIHIYIYGGKKRWD